LHKLWAFITEDALDYPTVVLSMDNASSCCQSIDWVDAKTPWMDQPIHIGRTQCEKSMTLLDVSFKTSLNNIHFEILGLK
jgi:hypothetical protein